MAWRWPSTRLPARARRARCAADPLALGAVVRTSSPASSATCFAGTLASANRDCAAAATSIARLSASGSRRATDLLSRLSSHPDAPDAVLAAAIATSREDEAVSRGAVGAIAGIFPCGLALEKLACAAASADDAAARPA